MECQESVTACCSVVCPCVLQYCVTGESVHMFRSWGCIDALRFVLAQGKLNMQTKSLAWCHFAAYLRYDCTEMLHPKMFVSISTFLSLCVLLQVYPTSCSTKYYVAKNSELKKRLDEQKKMVSKDPIQTSNSNAYYIEDGYNSQELGGGGYDHYGYSDGHHYVAIEKKHSKFFGDELSFVIIVVTLTVFFGILS